MSSTNANLMFLEAQLDEYLHSHENDAVAKKLWVTDRGFRLPYRRERWSLHDNMMFIERQLEEYLHEHEVVGNPDTCEPLVYDTNLAVSPDAYITAGGDTPIPFGLNNANVLPGYYTDVNNTHLTVETTDPQSGTRHIEQAANTSTQRMTIVRAEECGSSTFQYSARVQAQDVLTFSTWMKWVSGDQPDPIMSIEFLEGPPDYTTTAFHNYTATELGGPIPNIYTFYEVAETAPANSYFVIARIGKSPIIAGDSGVVRYDTFSIVVTDGTLPILYTNKVGFRFPYQDYVSPGSLESNMKFLETQISQYLHKHEVGAT